MNETTIYLDLEIGLKSGGAQSISVQDGRDTIGQDEKTGQLIVITRHSTELEEKLEIPAQNIAFIRTTKRTEHPERRAEDAGRLVSVGDVPH